MEWLHIYGSLLPRTEITIKPIPDKNAPGNGRNSPPQVALCRLVHTESELYAVPSNYLNGGSGLM